MTADSVPVRWPNGAQCAVALTFDFDSESLWRAKDPKSAELLATLSLGGYGAKVGVPKILELLKSEGLKATFFTPGWTVDNHTDRVEAILRDGHELAHHGYMHHWPDPDRPEQIIEELERGLEAMKRHFGVRPKGFRPPGSESCHFLLEALVERGFVYNSCFKDDVHPYRHRLRDGRPGPVELPEHPTLDDWNFGATHLRTPRPLFTREHVLSIWKDEFQEIYDWGGVFVLVMHPQVTGRPMRLATLRELIAFTRRFPKVWYATAGEVAEAFIAQERPLPRGAAG
jgi:peptidoglycan/xylan/chitin deacetylase (PgdA/CDA1 family)